jgi:DNA-binding response OmpR family regulator
MQSLSGKRVLIVENNRLIAGAMMETIARVGGRPLGPCTTGLEALAALALDPEMAILDAHMDDVTFDVATKLRQRGIPFIFAAGSPGNVPDDFRDVDQCDAPYTMSHLMDVLTHAVFGGRH